MTVLARLKGFNKHLVEAAADLGASEVDIVRRILLAFAFFVFWFHRVPERVIPEGDSKVRPSSMPPARYVDLDGPGTEYVGGKDDAG